MMELYAKMFQAVMPGNIEEMAKKEKGTVKKGITAIFLSWIVGLILAIIGIFLAVGNAGTEVQPAAAIFGGTVVGGIMILALLITQVLGLVISIVTGYIIHFAGSWVAKSFFKGTGNFPQQFYIAMLFGGAITIITSLLVFALGLVPFLGTIGGIVSMLFFLYSLYLTYITIKAVQKVETAGAVITMVAMLLLALAVAMAAVVIGGILAGALGITGAESAVAGL